MLESAKTAIPGLDTLICWVIERETMRRRREAGETPPFSTDEILAKYRFCNANVQDDRVSRAIFDTFTKPYADHPALVVALTVCRFTNAPEVFTAVRDCLVPFDPERFVSIMAGQKILERRACVIPGGVPGEQKAASLTRDLFIPLANAVESVRPKLGDTCEQVFERLRKFPYLNKGFITAQIVRDLKQVEPLRSAPDWYTFVRSGPGSQRGVNRILGAGVDRVRPETEWRLRFQEIVAQAAPRVAEHGIRLDAQSWQNVFCEIDKYLRFRSGDLSGARLYAPDGEAPPRAPKAAPVPIRPIEVLQPAAVRPLRPVIAPRNSGPHILFRDYETRSTLALDKVGVHRYAADPRTEVLCCAFAVDNEPVELWIPGEVVPPEFQEAATNPNWIAVAHNAAFEMAIEQYLLAPRFDWPQIPIERQRCTMAGALALSLPAKLETLAHALELRHQKDAVGHRLMLMMARPRKARKDEDPTRTYWFEDPDRLGRLYEYCEQDVKAERELFGRLQPLSPAELALWTLDATINQRGFRIDRELAEAARKVAQAAAPEIDAELAEVTDGAVTGINQLARMQVWLGQNGCAVEDLQQKTVAKLLESELPPKVQRALELRQDGGGAAVKKINALLQRAGDDGRVRGALQFHKASTGRWAGVGVQPQNLKRSDALEDIEAAITAVKTGDYEHVRKLYPRALTLLGDLGRSLIIAAPGHTLIGADFSSVESRVLAWVAGEQWKLDAHARYDATQDPRDEVYAVLACRMLHVPEGSFTPESPERRMGKYADLSCGYMGGGGAIERIAPGIFDEAQREQIKNEWRSAHPRVRNFWYEIDRAAWAAVQSRGSIVRCGPVAFRCLGTFLFLKLPSGRKLAYPLSRTKLIDPQRGVVLFNDNSAGRWHDCRDGRGAYGGVWSENVVQAIARDLLADAMLRVEAAGYPIVLHLHDEIVCEVPEGFGSTEEFTRIMTRAPSWALTLPIAAKAWTGPRFG